MSVVLMSNDDIDSAVKILTRPSSQDPDVSSFLITGNDVDVITILSSPAATIEEFIKYREGTIIF